MARETPVCLGTRTILLRVLGGCHVVGLGGQATLLPACLPWHMDIGETEEAWLEMEQHGREAGGAMLESKEIFHLAFQVP